jgi:hypothetical protein
MVWALDNKKNIYVREGIFNDFQVGTGWVLVSGIEAVELSIRQVDISFCGNKYFLGKAFRLVLGKFMYLAVGPYVQ